MVCFDAALDELEGHTRMSTLLPLRSTSVMESLLERDMVAFLRVSIGLVVFARETRNSRVWCMTIVEEF
jgi:hypothetical protein